MKKTYLTAKIKVEEIIKQDVITASGAVLPTQNPTVAPTQAPTRDNEYGFGDLD